MPLLQERDLGCLAFSPMDTGLLAAAEPADPALRGLVQCIDEVANQLGVPRAVVCVSWVAQQVGITSVLCGAESPEQVRVNTLGSTLTLPGDALEMLDVARQRYRRAQRRAG